MSQTFVTRIEQGANKNVTGIVVPPDVVEALGSGKKPAVKITLNGGAYSYRSTVAVMGTRFMIGFSAEHRQASGIRGGDEVSVTLELDRDPRDVALPADLQAALQKAGLLDAFEKSAPSKRGEFVRQVETAKAADTRERRVQKIVESLGK